jgi:hypothetical protein
VGAGERSLVSWGAVIAGAIAACTLTLLLVALGVALGLTAVSPWTGTHMIASYQVTGDLFFSFRHFQALSNELITPKVLACPADTREAAASFISFNNKNLSYFIGLKADYSRPYSILAGDRNLTNDYANMPTLLRPQINRGWRWTPELHQFKGNLLFADVHVEEKSSKTLNIKR